TVMVSQVTRLGFFLRKFGKGRMQLAIFVLELFDAALHVCHAGAVVRKQRSKPRESIEKRARHHCGCRKPIGRAIARHVDYPGNGFFVRFRRDRAFRMTVGDLRAVCCLHQNSAMKGAIRSVLPNPITS
ncbi:MAG: hypothetical protein ACYC9P_12275, partial [Rudaea sp.]